MWMKRRDEFRWDADTLLALETKHRPGKTEATSTVLLHVYNKGKRFNLVTFKNELEK